MKRSYQEESKKTEFNSSIATLERLDRWLKYAGMYSLEQNYVSWKLSLDLVENEIWAKLTQEEIKELQQKKDVIEKIFLGVHAFSAQRKIPVKNVISPLWQLLPMYEKRLRKLADDHGMLMAEKSTIWENM